MYKKYIHVYTQDICGKVGSLGGINFWLGKSCWHADVCRNGIGKELSNFYSGEPYARSSSPSLNGRTREEKRLPFRGNPWREEEEA